MKNIMAKAILAAVLMTGVGFGLASAPAQAAQCYGFASNNVTVGVFGWSVSFHWLSRTTVTCDLSQLT